MSTPPVPTDAPRPGLSRRRFGRAALLGGSLSAAAVGGLGARADAAPLTDPWLLGGNTGVTNDGTNYLGTRNVAPLIFKTASTAGSPVERMRIAPSGQVRIRGVLGVGAAPVTTTQVTATTASTTGTGVWGSAPNSIGTALDAAGVRGTGTVGVLGNGEYMGVQGSSVNYAVFGFTTPDTGGIGVYGRGGLGVKGRSYSGSAVLGDTDSGNGVKGEAYSSGTSVKGVYGQCFGENGNGVVGEASNGTSAYGVWGISSNGYAGVFSGKALVTGTLSKGGGSFKIDHPLDPQNKYLYHSFVESPDMMNIYNGNVTTGRKGRATVRLPDYFEALNRDFRYQLTVIGDFAQAVVEREVRDGKFVIRTDKPSVKVSWQVTGVRKDAFAEANRIPVTEDKGEDERGTYLHPEAHGKPAQLGVLNRRMADRPRASDRQKDPVAPR